MRRRAFLFALGVATLPAWAQVGGRRRVAVITIGSLKREPMASLVEGLRDLGQVEGASLEFIPPAEKGGYPQLVELARAAVEHKVDVIFSYGTSATEAAAKATRTIPIVMLVGADPITLGLVRNLARPEGNVTGLFTVSQDLAIKRIELLREIVPGMRRLAVLWNPASTGQGASLKLVEEAARQMGMATQATEVRSAADLERVALAWSRARPDAMLALPNTMLPELTGQLLKLAASRKLPSAFTSASFVRAGALIAYSADENAQVRRAAYYVDRILKGAKPGALPVEQPTQFRLAVNLKTAKALGLSVPRSVIVRADEVIE